MTHTIHSVLTDLQTQLTAVSDAPKLEAEWILELATGIDRQGQRRHEAQLVSSEQMALIHSLTERRTSGQPLAYVLGEQHFWTLRLKVSPAVLIPRPETELVIERALHYLPSQQAAAILDLGTGSGAIALAVAQERPATKVLAVDLSSDALAVAADNAELHGIGNVEFLQSDWFSNIPPQRFALILSNPPYIAAGDPHLEAAVLIHEPYQALISGTDGLQAIRHIIQQAPEFLAPQGWLILEHGWQQAKQVRGLLESTGFSSVASHADLAGHLRVTEAQLI